MRRLPLLLLAGTLVGCSGEDIQLPGLTVAIATDAAGEFDTVLVEASRSGDDYSASFSPNQLPGFVFLGCDASSLGFCGDHTIELRVVGRQGATQERVVRTAELRYPEDDTNRLLHTPLCAACLDVECDAGTTCVRGACLDTAISPSNLPVDDVSLPLDDGECGQLKCVGTCATGCGSCPPNETVTIGTGGSAFQIDKHEVTRDEYAAFLAADVSLEGQPEVCSWNRDFAPSTDPDPERKGCMESSSVCQGENCGAHPQVCVDWCDASAYCSWRGMRLCGSRQGGSLDIEMLDDPSLSQWLAACSAEGTTDFPYGQGYVEQQCNDGKAALETTVEVGTSPACVTATGIFDLSGNVAEWTDSCLPPDSNGDNCAQRGGYFGSTTDTLNCVAGDDGYTRTSESRSASSPRLGFRCCSL